MAQYMVLTDKKAVQVNASSKQKVSQFLNKNSIKFLSIEEVEVDA